MNGKDGEHLHLRSHLPAHQDLLAAVAVQIPVVHAVDGGAAALDDGALGVALLRPLIDIDLQRPLVAAPAEKGQGLLLPVAV